MHYAHYSPFLAPRGPTEAQAAGAHNLRACNHVCGMCGVPEVRRVVSIHDRRVRNDQRSSEANQGGLVPTTCSLQFRTPEAHTATIQSESGWLMAVDIALEQPTRVTRPARDWHPLLQCRTSECSDEVQPSVNGDGRTRDEPTLLCTQKVDCLRNLIGGSPARHRRA